MNVTVHHEPRVKRD